MRCFNLSFANRLLRVASYLLLTSAACVIQLRAQPSSDPLPNFWRTDGTVNAVVVTNNLAYIGGDFTYVGPSTGAAGLIDPDFGEALPGFPQLNGTVRAITGDGAGGWFVGGTFSPTDAPTLKNLVHVLADNTLDQSFSPNPDNTVRALLLLPGTLIVGGEFFTINSGQSSPYLAFLSPTTGAPTTTRIRPNTTVGALALDGDTVYMGGTFSQLTVFTNNNQQVSVPRARLAAFKPATAEILPWNPGSTGGFEGVKAIAISPTAVYVGGDFTQCGTKPRVGVASLNKTDGTANSWNPNTQFAGGTPVINALAFAGNVLYAGGDFSSIGARAHFRLAALQATGLGQGVSGWQADANGEVQMIVPFGNSILVGGKFTVIGGTLDLTNPNVPVQTGGTPRKGFAQIDQATAVVADWGPHISSLKPVAVFGANANGSTYALAQQGGEILVGGDFASIGGTLRGRVAAIDLASGVTTPWNPNADGTVRALAATPVGVYVGGNFNTIGGQARSKIALIKSDTGLADTWNPNAQNGQFVSAIAYAGGSVFVGGSFSKIGGADRSFLAEIDASSGAATAWTPQVGGAVNTLLFNKGQLYVGGAFFGISGSSIQNLALLNPKGDTATQLVKTFNPLADGQVRSLALDQGLLFVGGDFTKIAGQDRKGVAAIDPATGQEPNPLDVQLTGQGQLQARTVLPVGQQLYIGGSFRGAGGENRGRIASVHNVFGAASGWDPGADAAINAVARTDNVILIGGEFTRLGLKGATPNAQTDGQPVQYFAAFNSRPAVHNLRKNTVGHWVFDLADGDGLGTNIQVQTNDKLGAGGWQTLTTLDIIGIQDPYEDGTSAASPKRFYRLFRTP
jgi:hypothetical protein